MPTKVYLLTGDIGGTNSRMHLYDTSSTEILVEKYYQNENHLKTKEDGVFEKNIIRPFLELCSSSVKLDNDDCEIVAALACAGPVRGNKVTMSNAGGIVVDGEAIASQRHVSGKYLDKIKVCRIINDFVAQGFGCLTLKPEETRELVAGSHGMIDPTGPKVCVGAGTGLGECYLTPDSDGNYGCFASEGGHVEYAPRNTLEIKLWEYLKAKFNYKNRISVERVVSGRGLANVYEFLAKEFPNRVDKKVHEEFKNAGDMQGKVVAVNAKEGSLCLQAMDIMMSAYGCEVGSAGVKFIPTGGLYVTGGLTPKNIQHIEGESTKFMQSYFDKGRVKPVLESVPLFAVMVEDLGVRGAHKCASMEYERYISKKGGDSVAGAVEPAQQQSEPSNENFMYAAAIGAIGFAAGVLMSKSRKL